MQTIMQNTDDHLSEQLKEWNERRPEDDDILEDLAFDVADNKIKSRKEDCDEK